MSHNEGQAQRPKTATTKKKNEADLNHRLMQTITMGLKTKLAKDIKTTTMKSGRLSSASGNSQSKKRITTSGTSAKVPNVLSPSK